MKNSKKMLAFDIILTILLIIYDQYTKILITPLKNSEPIVYINNVLEITYLENRGAAFGILQGQRILFILIAAVVLVVMGFFFVKIPAKKKYIKLNVSLVLILAGALGNTIDRASFGYVRDFIYFKIINFPVFNVADIYITCSTIWLAIMILFCFKENDLDFLIPKEKKTVRNDAITNAVSSDKTSVDDKDK